MSHAVCLCVKEFDRQEILYGIYRGFEEPIEGSLLGKSCSDYYPKTSETGVLRGLFEPEGCVTSRKIPEDNLGKKVYKIKTQVGTCKPLI